MDSDQNSEDPMVLTKNKRDEFLVEIRRKKATDIINQKRMKFFDAGNQMAFTKIVEEDWTNPKPLTNIEDLYNQPENPELNVRFNCILFI
jgi:hypothetical protein